MGFAPEGEGRMNEGSRGQGEGAGEVQGPTFLSKLLHCVLENPHLFPLCSPPPPHIVNTPGVEEVPRR